MIGENQHLMYNLINPTFRAEVSCLLLPRPRPTRPSDNWDPRVGLAYDPFADHKTSIRASFGMFHNVVYSRDLNYWLQPPFLTATQTSAQGLAYPIAFSNLGPGNNTITVPTDGTLSITNGDYYGVHSTPYQMQWNLNIQREIMENTVFTIGYVGSHNLHMFIQRDFNYSHACCRPERACRLFTMPPAFPIPGSTRNTTAFSLPIISPTRTTTRLQTSLEHRFSHGWQTQVSYTWSKSIDDGSGTYGLDGGGIIATRLMWLRQAAFQLQPNAVISGQRNLQSLQGERHVGQVVNGWQLTGVFVYLSGAPANPTSATNRVFTGTGSNTGRPDASRDATSTRASRH